MASSTTRFLALSFLLLLVPLSSSTKPRRRRSALHVSVVNNVTGFPFSINNVSVNSSFYYNDDDFDSFDFDTFDSFVNKFVNPFPFFLLSAKTSRRSNCITFHRISFHNATVNSSSDSDFLLICITDLSSPYVQLSAKITCRRGIRTDPASFAACFPARQNDLKWFSSTSSDEAFSFKDAGGVLRSIGRSLSDRPQLTLFAPRGNLSDFSSILRCHLVPCTIPWSDLVTSEDGALIRTYERGFALNVTKCRSCGMLLVNGVVHGIRELLSASNERGKGAEGSCWVSTAAAEDDAEASSLGFNQCGEDENPDDGDGDDDHNR